MDSSSTSEPKQFLDLKPGALARVAVATWIYSRTDRFTGGDALGKLKEDEVVLILTSPRPSLFSDNYGDNGFRWVLILAQRIGWIRTDNLEPLPL